MPEPENHGEDPGDRDRLADHTEPRRPERARDHERPDERHRPRDDLSARQGADVPSESAPLRGDDRRRAPSPGAVVDSWASACSRRPTRTAEAVVRTYAVACAGRVPIGRAGTPPTIASGGTSRVTTAPAATTQPRPSVTPGRIVARVPIQTLSSMTTGRVSTGNGSSTRWDAVSNATSGEMLTASPMTRPPRASRQQLRLIRELAPIASRSAHLPGPVEPDVATEKDRRALERHAEHAPVPGAAQREARDTATT